MEEWKQIKGFPNYKVSNEGRVKNHRLQHILKPYIDNKGYARVTLSNGNERKSIKVGKLVVDTFLENTSGKDVRYRDYNRTNTVLDNLYLSTRKETVADTYFRNSKLDTLENEG